MNRKRTLIISTIILITAIVVTTLIFVTEPTAKMEGATKESAMLVDVMRIDRGSYQPVVVSTGTVEPSQDVTLSPRVNGQVIRISSSFIPGGFVNMGQILLQIDPADYENTLDMRKSDLQQAIADLNIEMGRQNIAQKDYELLEESLTLENESLVLREPQLNAARSRVDAAQAAVKQAELDLQRTTVRAPFNAHVLSRDANVGSLVSPGENIGRLVGINEYWVEVTVPLSEIRWLTFPGTGQRNGSEVKIRNRSAWKEGEFRTGYLYKLVGALDDETRLARVLVSVPDPLANRTENKGLPALIIGEFVEANINATELTDIIRLSRDYVRSDETVWVMEEGKLRIRNIEILFRDAQYAYITGGLNQGDQVVTTNLRTVTDGVRLRTEQADSVTHQSLPPDSLDYPVQPTESSG
jgi:RND family efflux transporter MFP subunit